MFRLFLSLLLTAGVAQAIDASSLDVRYDAETGMYQSDLSSQSLTNGQDVVLEFSYPFPTVTNVYLELKGNVQIIPTSGSEPTADALTTLDAPGGWLSDTIGLDRIRIKLRAQGAVQLKSVTADCGRSKRVLQQRGLSPLQPVSDEIGSVRVLSTDLVTLHPREAYYAIATPHLSAAQMRSYSGLIDTPNRFSTSFYVSNPTQHAVTGNLGITLPAWAKVENTRVYFYSSSDPLFGLTQPADSIQFNDDTPLVPNVEGWARLNGSPYRKMATNETMTLTWNQFRDHARETKAVSLFNPVTFKGRALYEYLQQDGNWGILIRSPWISCPIPVDASRAPVKIRATCLGGIEHGNFAAKGLLVIPSSLLFEDDYFLPIDDGDGRGSPFPGWKMDGMNTQGTQHILGVTFQLDANPNPLQLKAHSTSSLTAPGPQVLMKVEVTR